MPRSNLTPSASSRLRLTLMVAVVALGFGVTVWGDFVYDDDILIRNNPTVKDPTLFARTVFGSIFTNTINEGFLKFFRPLVLSSYFLTYQIFGLTPWPFHVTNLLIHLLNGHLLYHVVRCWFGLRRGPAFVSALLFLAHPLQTEPVSWISGRTDLLCASGVLGTLLLAWHWLLHRRRWMVPALTAVSLVGLLSKELAVVTPALFIVLVWTRWRVISRGATPVRDVGCLSVLLAVMSLGFMVWRGIALAEEGSLIVWPTGDPSTTRLTVPNILMLYARLLIFPHPPTLDYTATNFGVVNTVGDVLFWLPLFGTLTLGVVSTWALWRRRAAGAALAWFWIVITPVSQIRPLVVLAAEHYMYLAVLSIAVLAGMAVQIFATWARSHPHILRCASALGIIAMLGLITVDLRRCLIWRDNLTLFRHAHAHDPMNRHKAHTYAQILIGHGREAEALEILRTHGVVGSPQQCQLEGICLINLGQIEEGIAHLKKSLEYGQSSAVYTHLAQWGLHSGDMERAEALGQTALRLNAFDTQAMRLLARVARETGDFDLADQMIRRALVVDPEDIDSHTERAHILIARGRETEALGILDRANHRLRPTPDSLGLQAWLCLRGEDWGGAAGSLEQLLEIDSENVDTLVDLGLACARLGRTTEARRHWRRALEINHQNEPARRNLAATRRASEALGEER